jgi:hypothetical protein
MLISGCLLSLLFSLFIREGKYKTMEQKDMVALLSAQKNICDASRDFIVSTDRVKAVIAEGGDVKLKVNRLPLLDLTEFSHSQVAEKCGIPQKY